VIKLDNPAYTARESFDLCNEGIGSVDFKNRFNVGIDNLCQMADTYCTEAIAGNLFEIASLPENTNDDFIVAEGITKKEFITLYEYYLRNKEKPGRAIYDFLMVSANEKCPYCGGIGRPKNLDHFMPKSLFPQFSTIPLNLVPSCRDCNMDGKGKSFASVANEQIIHPYLDKDIFFNEQWISAQIKSYDPCSIEYYASPPCHWILTDKERVKTHFHDFELSKRYSIQAAEELSILVDQRKGIMKNMSPVEFRAHLLSLVEAPIFINHWKKIMYHCLSSDEKFFGYEF